MQMIKIQVLKNIGIKGKSAAIGEIHEVDPQTAQELIRLKKARLMSDPVRVKLLKDDLWKGMRAGMVIEMSSAGAENLIKEGSADFFYDDNAAADDESPKVKIEILRGVSAKIDDKMQSLAKGKVYALAPSEAAIIIGIGKAKFPDTIKAVTLKFKTIVTTKGAHYKEGDTAKMQVADAEDLVKRGLAEPIGFEEGSLSVQE